jgi:hypothetical protein
MLSSVHPANAHKDETNAELQLSKVSASLLNNLSVTLKVSTSKNGEYGLFAQENISKGRVIAYYDVQIYRRSRYKSKFKNGQYILSVVPPNSTRASTTFLGDLYVGSVKKPVNNISFWAHFANEPSVDEDANSSLYYDPNLKQNKEIKKLKEGQICRYKLIALRDIDIDEEIMWCYGDGYSRSYKTSCK